MCPFFSLLMFENLGTGWRMAYFSGKWSLIGGIANVEHMSITNHKKYNNSKITLKAIK